jgi:hypothetical protein
MSEPTVDVIGGITFCRGCGFRARICRCPSAETTAEQMRREAEAMERATPRLAAYRPPKPPPRRGIRIAPSMRRRLYIPRHTDLSWMDEDEDVA